MVTSRSTRAAPAAGLPPAFRHLVEEAIECLLLVLDELDGDPDLEEPGDLEITRDDDEPSLGWCDKEARTGRYGWHGYSNSDLEAEHDGREPDDEDEECDDWPDHDSEMTVEFPGGCIIPAE